METTTQTPEEGALIAPGEIRELVARLTEQTVEAVPAHESRTLEALAIETGIPVARLRATLAEMRRKRPAVPPAAWAGFVVLAAVAGWALRPTPVVEPVVAEPPSVTQPVAPKVEPDLAGTVPLTNVTYGPDGGSLSVDPAFEPSATLPEGLSVSANVGNVLWGSGDHRASVIDRALTPAEEKAVRANVQELLRYVRESAARRHLLPSGASTPSPVSISCYTYSGAYGTSVQLPQPGAAFDKSAEKAIGRAAKQVVDQLQDMLRSRREWSRANGP